MSNFNSNIQVCKKALVILGFVILAGYMNIGSFICQYREKYVTVSSFNRVIEKRQIFDPIIKKMFPPQIFARLPPKM